MRRLVFACSTALLTFLVGCASIDPSPSPSPQGAGIRLSSSDAEAIGRKIWSNECGGTIQGLTSWNEGEDFPSLGIGHFIWYPVGRRGPFEESFPPLITYMGQRGVRVPAWIADSRGAPWQSRSEFLAERDSLRMNELRQFLSDNVPVQTGFIVQRLELALPKMEDASTPADRERLHQNFYQVASTRTGVYALIDYVNFKGEGIKAEESYRGQGWGLRNVLLEMGPTGSGPSASVEFSEAAKRVLTRRVSNSPPERSENRWLPGWKNRCDTYRTGI